MAALCAALLLGAAPRAFAGETRVRLYVARGAMARETALSLAALAEATYPQAEWDVTFEEDEGLSLRELVMRDRAPQIAFCAPQEALPWAKEGLLLPLDGRAGDLSRMQSEAVEACVHEETLFMIPLMARHRRVAVNARMLSSLGLDNLLDARSDSVWTPSELIQAVEETALSGGQAMEVWLPDEDTAAGLEAFVQCLYGGRLLAPDGRVTADSEEMENGLDWLCTMAASGLIGCAEGREAALEHFLDGQVLLFADWTDEDAALAAARDEPPPDVVEIPYPTADNVPVRAFEMTGAAVFAGRDAQAVGLAMNAASLFAQDARAQRILGERGLGADGALWLPCLSASEDGATLRGLFAEALRGALSGEQEPAEALARMAAAARTVLTQKK